MLPWELLTPLKLEFTRLHSVVASTRKHVQNISAPFAKKTSGHRELHVEKAVLGYPALYSPVMWILQWSRGSRIKSNVGGGHILTLQRQSWWWSVPI